MVLIPIGIFFGKFDLLLFPVLPPILFSSFSPPLLFLFFLFFLPFFSLHPVTAVLSSLCTRHQRTRTCAAAHHHQTITASPIHRRHHLCSAPPTLSSCRVLPIRSQPKFGHPISNHNKHLNSSITASNLLNYKFIGIN